MNNVIKYILISIVILLLQVLVLNNLNIKGYAIPFLYLWIILRLPASMSRILTITIGFLIGLTVDIFSNTLGMHAMATTLFAYLKDPTSSSDGGGTALIWNYNYDDGGALLDNNRGAGFTVRPFVDNDQD